MTDEALTVWEKAQRVEADPSKSREEKELALRTAASEMSRRYSVVKSLRMLGAEDHEILPVVSELEEELGWRLQKLRTQEAALCTACTLPKCTAEPSCQVESHSNVDHCSAFREALASLRDH